MAATQAAGATSQSAPTADKLSSIDMSKEPPSNYPDVDDVDTSGVTLPPEVGHKCTCFALEMYGLSLRTCPVFVTVRFITENMSSICNCTFSHSTTQHMAWV